MDSMADFLHKAVSEGLAEIIGLFPSNPNIFRHKVWLFLTAILWIRF